MKPEHILKYRVARGLTQMEAAAEIGVNQSTWARWEKHGPKKMAVRLLEGHMKEFPAPPEAEIAG